MGMLSDENSNRGKAGPSASKNSSLSAGASKSGSTGKASVGGGKASNPASKTSSASASAGARTSSTGGSSNRTASASVGGGKSSNPASKTGGSSQAGSRSAGVGTVPAQRAVDSFTKSISGFTDAVARGLGQVGKTVTDMSNAAAGKLASDLTTTKPQGFTRVAAAGAGWTEVENPDGTVTRRTGTRAWRNNNPGNIEYGEFAKKMGAIGSDGRFAVFATEEAGKKAKESLLFDSKGYAGKTIKEAISRYAPAFENDTAGYSKRVAAAAGVPTSTKLSDMTPAQRQAMMSEMARVEGFKVGKERTLMDSSDSIQTVGVDGKYTGGIKDDSGFSKQVVNSGVFNDMSSIGSLVDSALNAIGGKSSTPANSKMEGSPVSMAATDDPKSRPRLGLGKLSEDIKGKKAADVVKGVANAIRDPIGFALNTIEDGWNQNGGLAGLKSDFADIGNPFDKTTPVGKNGEYLSPLVATRAGNGGAGSNKTATSSDSSASMAAVTPLTPKERTPFWWSNLLGSTTIS